MSEERQKNLERWERLAPQECYLQRYGMSSTPYWVVRGIRLDAVNVNSDYYLLGALIEAITARGWSYAIKGGVYAGTCKQHGTVWRDPDTEPKATDARGDSPADALLSAYLQAIEAKENS